MCEVGRAGPKIGGVREILTLVHVVVHTCWLLVSLLYMLLYIHTCWLVVLVCGVYHFGDSSFYEQCCVDLCTPCFDFHNNDLTVDVSPLTQGDEKSRNESALNYIVIAANGGHAGAQTKLGECYALGKYGMEEGNWKEARKWYGGGVVVGGGMTLLNAVD